MTSANGMAVLVAKADQKPPIPEPRRSSSALRGDLFERIRKTVEEQCGASDEPAASDKPAASAERADAKRAGAGRTDTQPEARESGTDAPADLLPEESGAVVCIPVPYQLMGDAAQRSGGSKGTSEATAAAVGMDAVREIGVPAQPQPQPQQQDADPVLPENAAVDLETGKPAPDRNASATDTGWFRPAAEAAAPAVGSASAINQSNSAASTAETSDSPAGPAVPSDTLAGPAAGESAGPGDNGHAFGRGEKAPDHDAPGLSNRPIHAADEGRFAVASAAAPGMTASLPAEEKVQGSLLVRQIVDSIEYVPSTGKNEMVIRLQPDVFGELKIDLEMTDDRLTARIVTDSHPTRVLLQSHLSSLQDALAEKGIPVREILVEYADAGADTPGNPAGDPRRHAGGDRAHPSRREPDREAALPAERVRRSARPVRTGGIDMMA